MVPPDGVRSKRLPTMSWESVVDDGATSVDADPPRADVPHDAHRSARVRGGDHAADPAGPDFVLDRVHAVSRSVADAVRDDDRAHFVCAPHPRSDAGDPHRTTGRAVRPHESDRHGDHRPCAAGRRSRAVAVVIPCRRLSPILRRILWPWPLHLLPMSLTHPPHRPADIPSTELPRIVEATPVPEATPFDGVDVGTSEPQIDPRTSAPPRPTVRPAARSRSCLRDSGRVCAGRVGPSPATSRPAVDSSCC